MRIVIDGRLWSESGIGRYIRNLVISLQQIDHVNEYFILLRRKDYETTQITRFTKVLADFGWYGISEQLLLPKILLQLKPDLVHFPHFNVPLIYRGQFVVTIHDLIHQHHATRQSTTRNPLTFALKKRMYHRVFAYATKRSLAIVTPSQFVKNQLVKEWSIGDEKVTVTHEGIEEKISQIAKTSQMQVFRKLAKKFNIREPFLFYVGNAQPHKNLSKLIEVVEKLSTPDHKISLVMAGPPHRFWDRLPVKDKKAVTVVGFVSDQELVALYQNALALVMPSLEEGFGIPLLEAMACGCPVISSNAGSLPEVGGKACLYFDPLKVGEMEKQICQLACNPALADQLIDLGYQQARKYSWLKMAQQTLDIYQSTQS